MKKQITVKLVAMMITLMLTLTSISSLSFATITETTNKASIVIEGVEQGIDVSLYQLTTVNYDYTADEPQGNPYTWNASVKTWIEEHYPTYSDPAKFNSKEINADDAEAFYSNLTKAIKSGSVTIQPKYTKKVEGTVSFPITLTNVEFTGCEMGTYLVVMENGYRVYTPSVINITPKFDQEEKVWKLDSSVKVEVKSTTPQIKKTVTDGTKTSDNYSTTDDIPFTILTDVPKYLENSVAKKYTIGDKLSSGLILKEGSIEVFGVNGERETKLTEGYTLKTEGATNTKGEAVTFTIDFNYEAIKNYSQIKVTYQTNLSKSTDLVVSGEGNTNHAYLEYSNNPYVENSVQIQTTPGVKVYTYGIGITKTDKANEEIKLPGAGFTLSTQDGSVLSFVKKGIFYYLAKPGEEGATTTLVTDENGVILLYGLDAGRYFLKEIKAPDGYHAVVQPREIKIEDEEINGIIDHGDNTGIYKLNFPNSQGFQLPVTGGIGTTLFVAGGIILVGFGIALLIVVNKKNKK